MHSRLRDVLWDLEVIMLTLLSLVASSLLTVPVLKLPFQSTGTGILKANATHGYYRTLVLDVKNESLYVGAAEYIYRINLRYPHEPPVTSGALKPDKAVENMCKQLVGDKLDGQCRNHISVIIPREDGSIIACGNGARSVQANHYTLDTKTLQVRYNITQYGGLKCDVPSLEGNSSVVLVDQGNPFDYPALYLATNKIIRPALKDETGITKLDMIQTHMDSKWLNNPSFVGSYLEKDHVYFWFREVKYRLSSFTPDIFSRVARICVNDKGGSQKGILKGLWTSYFKGTLNCSIPGGHPYYFTELKDIVKINEKIHAIFTTPLTGPYGSAVCTFSQSEIDKMFLSGKFMDAENHYELYQPDTNPKPGQQCSNDSFAWTDSLKEADLKKYMYSVLMHDAVQHDYQKPAYYEADIVFRKLAVETFPKRPDITVYYIATTQGQIYKTVTWTNDKGSIESHLLVVFEPHEPLFIWDMKLYGDNLFLATESKVFYQPTKRCKSYMDCFSCSRDPHCGWNPYSLGTELCQPYDGRAALIQNVGTNDFSTCNTTQHHSKTIQLPGDMIHLPCVGRFGVSGPVQWLKDGKAVKIDFKKRFITKEDGLIIDDAQEEDKGLYTCQVSDQIKLVIYDVTINGDCIKGTANEKLMCAYIGGYRKWCREFDSYQTYMNHWQTIASNCSKCTDNDKLDNAHCGAARPKTSR